MRPYSMAVAPSSFFHSFVKVANIQVPPVAADPLTMHAKACQSLKPAPHTMPQGTRSYKMLAVFARYSPSNRFNCITGGGAPGSRHDGGRHTGDPPIPSRGSADCRNRHVLPAPTPGHTLCRP